MSQQRQAPQQPPRRPMTNQQVEQYLGQQYARMLKDMPAHAPAQNTGRWKNIRDSLQMLGRFNQVSLQIQRPKNAQYFFQ